MSTKWRAKFAALATVESGCEIPLSPLGNLINYRIVSWTGFLQHTDICSWNVNAHMLWTCNPANFVNIFFYWISWIELLASFHSLGVYRTRGDFNKAKTNSPALILSFQTNHVLFCCTPSCGKQISGTSLHQALSGPPRFQQAGPSSGGKRPRRCARKDAFNETLWDVPMKLLMQKH